VLIAQRKVMTIPNRMAIFELRLRNAIVVTGAVTLFISVARRKNAISKLFL
jgi:hypothetical protein